MSSVFNNTLKDLTFDNIYHEHYNYWSLTSLVYFFNQFNVKYESEKINARWFNKSLYKKDKIKIENSKKND